MATATHTSASCSPCCHCHSLLLQIKSTVASTIALLPSPPPRKTSAPITPTALPLTMQQPPLQPPPQHPPPNPRATGSASSTNKRKKGDELTTAYVYSIARVIQNTYNMADWTETAKDRLFRDFFGCGAYIVVLLWNMMDELDVLPHEVEVVHLLWTLYWMKCYPTESPCTATVGKQGRKVDPKTFRKYVYPIVYAIASLEPYVVSLCFFCARMT